MLLFDINKSKAVFCWWAHIDEIGWALRNYTPSNPDSHRAKSR